MVLTPASGGTGGFDYERDTRRHYMSRTVAASYHQEFAGLRGLPGLRFRVIAARERAIVGRFVRRVAHRSVLDVPAGTGKLAGVLSGMDADIVAGDISPDMLAIARAEYERLGYSRVRFEVVEAERLGQALGRRFDVVVCLRLLHRVPAAERRVILDELATVADHAVVSTAVTSRYHSLRRRARRRLLGGENVYSSVLERRVSFEAALNERFVVLGRSWVVPFLSEEVIYLLRPRTAMPRAQ